MAEKKKTNTSQDGDVVSAPTAAQAKDQWVEIQSFGSMNGDPVIEFVASLSKDGGVTFDDKRGHNKAVIDDLKAGIPGLDGTTRRPEDGIDFLKAVQKRFRNTSRLAATEIKTGGKRP